MIEANLARFDVDFILKVLNNLNLVKIFYIALFDIHIIFSLEVKLIDLTISSKEY